MITPTNSKEQSPLLPCPQGTKSSVVPFPREDWKDLEPLLNLKSGDLMLPLPEQILNLGINAVIQMTFQEWLDP